MSAPSPVTDKPLRQAEALRRRFLMTVMIVGCLWGGLMNIPAHLGWVPLGPAQTLNNTAYFIFSCGALFVLWRWPRSFMPVAIVFFSASFVYFSAAQFLVHDDQLRMLLFFPMVGAIFLILGPVAAWMTVAGAIGVVLLAVATGDVPLSPLAISTFMLTLIVTGMFFHAFSVQATKAFLTISEQNAALDTAAREDALTRVLNLRAFRETMLAHVDETQDPAGFCLVFLDVDHFKAINDRYGHAVGDTVLVAIARTLQACVRERDVLARVGGEEFTILLPRTGLDAAIAIAGRLREAVQAMAVELNGTPLRVTVSVGVAASMPGESADALLHEADSAMYRAKQAGRNRVVVAPPRSGRAAP